VNRIAVLCPGRGSYTDRSLGSFPAGHPWLQRADELRAEYMLPSLTELDQASSFDKQEHLRAANVSPLIWLTTMLDAAEAREKAKLVCVAGNSLGWYSALAVGGALDFDDGFRLVQEMALMQEQHVGGGQLIYPIVHDDWRSDPEKRSIVEEALASSGGEALLSIVLGGYLVLAGSDAGMKHLMRQLPATQLGKNRYPFKLIGHGPYHTPFVAEVGDKARALLGKLQFKRPEVTLVDGRGVRFTPWSTDVDELREYTLGPQVTTPYDFTSSVRVVLREFAPDELVLPGPGNTLGAICGQVVCAEGWRGVHSKSDFESLQGGETPLVISMRR
jgi:malonyl CoA-acyl carrier protein transacylase